MNSPGHVVKVALQDHAYDVVVSPGVVRDAGTRLRHVSKSRRVAVVTDSFVETLHLPALLQSLKDHEFDPVVAVLPAGENFKSVASLIPVYETLLAARVERGTPLVALGGGVVGDMAGFVAATLLRGVPFVQVPTTLLSMVDASVGGKTGVNASAGKNLIGAFHQPILVLADPTVLSTLPKRELVGGLAECIKHDVIRDAEHFAKLEREIERAKDVDPTWYADLVAHNVAIKAKVVAADPFERGERAHLNFGHTFGHAIEKVSQYKINHGECVALGMVAASYTATKVGLLDDASFRRIVELIRKAGLPVSGLKYDVDEVVGAMAFDKKVAGGRVRFVLPDRIGHVVMRDDVPPGVVREAVEVLRG